MRSFHPRLYKSGFGGFIFRNTIKFILFVACSFPTIGHTQMPRKFRLGRMCKNEERNWQKARCTHGTNKIVRPSKMVGQNDDSIINMALGRCSRSSYRDVYHLSGLIKLHLKTTLLWHVNWSTQMADL